MIKTSDGYETIAGTMLVFRTRAGDTAVFAKHELEEEQTKKEMLSEGTTVLEEEHEGIGIRRPGQKAIETIYATIEDAEADKTTRDPA
jgi:hypothetical protein